MQENKEIWMVQTKRADFVKFDERRTWKTGGKHDMIAAVDHDAALCV